VNAARLVSELEEHARLTLTALRIVASER